MIKALSLLSLFLSVVCFAQSPPGGVTDATAYLHLFLTLADNGHEQADFLSRRRAAYINYMDLTREQGVTLLATVEEFQRQEATRQATALSIVGSDGFKIQPGSSAAAQLIALRQQRDSEVLKLVDKLLIQLGPDAGSKVSAHVHDVIMPRIRPIATPR